MEQKDKVHELIHDVEQYLETQSELIKLHAIEKASLASSALGSSMIVFSFFLLMLLFLSLALAYLLSDLFGKMSLGFAAVGIIYLIIGLILYSKKESMLQTPIANGIIKSFLKNG